MFNNLNLSLDKIMNFNEFYLSRKLISAKINLRKVLDMFMLLIKILSGNLLKLWTHDQ